MKLIADILMKAVQRVFLHCPISMILKRSGDEIELRSRLGKGGTTQIFVYFLRFFKCFD